MGEPGGAERGQCLGAVLGKPRPIAEFDRDRPAGQPLREDREGVEPRSTIVNPRCELEEDVAELARVGQRRHGGAKKAEGGVNGLGRKARRVDLPATRPPGLPRQEGLELRREALGLRMVPGQERVRFDVEDEARRRALDPADGVLGVGNRVVGAVHLDGVEDARVVAQARLRRHRSLWIEATALDERGIRPGADPDSHTPRETKRSSRRRRVGWRGRWTRPQPWPPGAPPSSSGRSGRPTRAGSSRSSRHHGRAPQRVCWVKRAAAVTASAAPEVRMADPTTKDALAIAAAFRIGRSVRIWLRWRDPTASRSSRRPAFSVRAAVARRARARSYSWCSRAATSTTTSAPSAALRLLARPTTTRARSTIRIIPRRIAISVRRT